MRHKLLQVPELDAYKVRAAKATPYSELISFCGMVNKNDKFDIAYCILVLETRCGRFHRLISYQDVVFLCTENDIHSSCKVLFPSFQIRQFICDPSIQTNNDDLLQDGIAFLNSWGSKGRADYARKVHPWVLQLDKDTINCYNSDTASKSEKDNKSMYYPNQVILVDLVLPMFTGQLEC